MEKALLETLEVLKIFNEKSKAYVLTNKEFNEEEENISQFIIEKQRLQKFLNDVRKVDLENRDLLRENLVELLAYYTRLMWQFGEMDELIRKLFIIFKDDL